MRRDGYGVAECDHDGNLPSTHPADVTWIGTVTDARNTPDPDCLMDFEVAREYAVNLVRAASIHLINGGDCHISYAVIHVTPDGWRPVMWAMPDGPNLHANIRLTLNDPKGTS